jgi:hypothetical protein
MEGRGVERGRLNGFKLESDTVQIGLKEQDRRY